MPKATVRTLSPVEMETPAQSIVTPASQLKFETDSLGRRIGCTKPTALLRFRLFKILGPDGARNEQLVGSAMLAFVVRQINEEPIMVPNTERQLEALIDRLDDPGIAAVAKCMIEQYGFANLNDDDEDAVKDTLKN